MHNPIVPETLEGWSLLHLMYRVRWDRLNALPEADRCRLADEAVVALAPPGPGATTLVQVLGHKADLMVILFRQGLRGAARRNWPSPAARWPRISSPPPRTSRSSSSGMYEMTAQIHGQLGREAEAGQPGVRAGVRRRDGGAAGRVSNRLFLEVPPARYVCFYPMNKRRGEAQNWYSEPFERRAAMMRDHGMIGRHYAGQVTQIISGSIGYDDWEWGVDLFADDPVVFKKLIYEMRFDEASAWFAEFGPFYTGLQFAPAHLRDYLAGRVPPLV